GNPGEPAPVPWDSATDSYQFLDTPAELTDYYYSVKALDASGLSSAFSVEVPTRPRDPGLGVPKNLTATWTVLDSGTNCSQPGGGCDPGACHFDLEDDDVIEAVLSWSAPDSGTGGLGYYRIYRKASDETRFIKVGQVPIATLSFPDTTVTKSDYTYYVVAVTSAATTESGGTATARAFETYPAPTSVRTLAVIDSRKDFTTDNKESRVAYVEWSRVTYNGLRGYNVYRRCGFGYDCSDTVAFDENDTFTCEQGWIRLNTAP